MIKRSILLVPFLASFIGQCIAQSASTTLHVNDASVRIHSNGLIGLNTGTGQAAYFIPTPGNSSPLYASGLWLAGNTFDLQPRISVHDHGPPYDFTTGPLRTSNGSLDPSSQIQFDRLWSISSFEQETYSLWRQCLSDPLCNVDEQFPGGYTIPTSFMSWPAHGDVDVGEALYLAPFWDEDQDGIYEPLYGDHPCLPGDQAIYCIFNDQLQNKTGGPAIGAEIHLTLFGYQFGIDALDQTVFAHYRIHNRSTTTLYDLNFGIFADFDLGCPTDDIIGTDVARNLVYVTNATNNDATCSSLPGYGSNPPAFGIQILKGARINPDGVDNTTTPIIPALNGLGFGDGIVDNEYHRLSRSMYFNGSGIQFMTEPTTENHYRNYARGLWQNGIAMSYGGSGYNEGSSTPCAFAFPRTSDPSGAGTNGTPQSSWSDGTSSSPAGDRKAIALTGPVTFAPGSVYELLVAYIYSPGVQGALLPTINGLGDRADFIEQFALQTPGLLAPGNFCDGPITSTSEKPLEGRLIVFPNPSQERITVQTPTSSSGTIVVLDDKGVEVLRRYSTSRSQDLDITALAPGTYFLRLVTAGTCRQGRFVKY